MITISSFNRLSEVNAVISPVAVITPTARVPVDGLYFKSPSDSNPKLPPSRSPPDVNTIALFSLVFSLSVIVTVVATAAVPAVKLVAVPEQFVNTPADGVPNAGVIRVGLVANTREPLPVSSLITP